MSTVRLGQVQLQDLGFVVGELAVQMGFDLLYIGAGGGYHFVLWVLFDDDPQQVLA